MQFHKIMRTLSYALLGLILLLFANSAFAAAPSAPSNLNVQADTAPGTSINILWTAPPEALDYYNIYRDYVQITSIDSDSNIAFVNGGVTNYIDSDTIPGETYYYQVTAVNAEGEESALATPIMSETATVAGKFKPHLGDDFSTDGAVCKFCHKVHLAQGSAKFLRKRIDKTKLTNIDICWTCHDGTGSDFNIQSQFDLPTTAHNTELQGNQSANIKCLNCHHPHAKPPNPRMTHELEENLCFTCHKTGGANGEGVSYPAAPKVKDVFDANDSNTNLTTGDIYTHPVTFFNDRHTNTFDENDSNGSGYATMSSATRHAECTDCHNQHQAARIGTTVLGPLEGGSGLLVDNGATTGVPSFTFSLFITTQYQVCFKCHSSFNPSWNSTPFYDNGYQTYPSGDGLPRGDKSVEFNTNNSAFHPVEGPGRNRSQNLCRQLLNGPNPLFDNFDCSSEAAAIASLSNATIDCTGCHNNTDAAIAAGEARGPHGSPNKSIRKASYWTDVEDIPNNWNSSNFSLCFSCHDVNTLKPDVGGSNFWSGDDDAEGKDSLHNVHLDKRIEATCKNCHYNIHSNQEAPNTQYRLINCGDKTGVYENGPPADFPTRMINFSPNITATGSRNKPQWSFDCSNQDRRCYLTCHGETMDPSDHWYNPDSGDLPTADQS